jgi:hypothetical protein
MMEIINLAQLARPFDGASLDLASNLATSTRNAGFERSFDNLGKIQGAIDQQRREKKKSDFAKKLEEQFGRASGLGDMERMVLANQAGYDPEGAAKDFMGIIERREKASLEAQKGKAFADAMRRGQAWQNELDKAAEEYATAQTPEAKALARGKYEMAYQQQQQLIAEGAEQRWMPEQIKLLGSPESASAKFASIESKQAAEKLAEQERLTKAEAAKQEAALKAAKDKRDAEELRLKQEKDKRDAEEARKRFNLDERKLALEQQKAAAALRKQNAELAEIEKKAKESKSLGTQSERVAAGYYNVLTAAEKRVKQPTKEDWAKYQIGIVTPTMQTQLDWLNAFLRKTSGAAITKEDIELERKALMPDVRDSKETIENKKKARQERINGIKGEAGVALQKIDAKSGQQKAVVKPKADPLGLF